MKTLSIVIEQALVKEVLELQEVKSCLSHFLASYESQLYTATAHEAKLQMQFVQANINELLMELKKVRVLLLSQAKPEVKETASNADEAAAIAYFNRDRRFTITE